ncbi:MAG: tetratricopeptide repeat protein, partial [Thermoanaerobaculia bacterium]
MIRHLAFFETIGTLDETSYERVSAFAGLGVLRVVDRILEDRADANPGEWAEVHSSRRNVEAMRDGDPARGILLRILDRAVSEPKLSNELGSDMLSYGRVLDLEARWPLAADVFQSVADSFPEREFTQLVIEASTALGAASRNAGNWDASATGYSRAEHLAASSGDVELGLIARIGMATSHMVRGNLPAAEAEIEEVLREAERNRSEKVTAIALHARASVAHSRGDYGQAVHFGYRSLELTTNPGSRDRIVADLAAAYAGLGMRDVARNAYSIVALTSPYQSVRWQATLNLMELSIEDGDVGAFDGYVTELGSAALDPRLRSFFLLLQARGSRRFDRGDFAARFETAREYAAAHGLHQLAFESESGLDSSEVT